MDDNEMMEYLEKMYEMVLKYLFFIEAIKKATTREDILLNLGLLQKVRDNDPLTKDGRTILEDIYRQSGDFAPLKKKLEEFNIFPQKEVS